MDLASEADAEDPHPNPSECTLELMPRPRQVRPLQCQYSQQPSALTDHQVKLHSSAEARAYLHLMQTAQHGYCEIYRQPSLELEAHPPPLQHHRQRPPAGLPQHLPVPWALEVELRQAEMPANLHLPIASAQEEPFPNLYLCHAASDQESWIRHHQEVACQPKDLLLDDQREILVAQMAVACPTSRMGCQDPVGHMAVADAFREAHPATRQVASYRVDPSTGTDCGAPVLLSSAPLVRKAQAAAVEDDPNNTDRWDLLAGLHYSHRALATPLVGLTGWPGRASPEAARFQSPRHYLLLCVSFDCASGCLASWSRADACRHQPRAVEHASPCRRRAWRTLPLSCKRSSHQSRVAQIHKQAA